MTNGINRMIGHLQVAAFCQDETGLTDGELVHQYAARRDEAAFEALVRRHGPMVLGVCQRVLRNQADAEDAFQAAFLVLVRKASSLRSPGTVSNWLYGVAHNTALKARAMNQKRRTKEREAATMPRREATEQIWCEIQLLLDAELSGLPDKYRLPIVLCDLEGKTIKEAARHVGAPQGTLATRLARGRALLAKRLAKHGLGLSAGVLTAALSHGTATADAAPALIHSTVNAARLFAAGQAAAAGVSVKVAALTEGVLKAMLLSKLKVAAVLFLVAATVAGGGGWLIYRATAADPPRTQQTPKKAENKVADAKKIQGTWKVTKEEVNGAESADSKELQKKCKWVITEDKITIEFDGQNKEFTYKLITTKKLKHIDVTDDGGQKVPGIYSLENDELKICQAQVGQDGPHERPQEFDTKDGKAVLLVFKRDKENND